MAQVETSGTPGTASLGLGSLDSVELQVGEAPIQGTVEVCAGCGLSVVENVGTGKLGIQGRGPSIGGPSSPLEWSGAPGAPPNPYTIEAEELAGPKTNASITSTTCKLRI